MMKNIEIKITKSTRYVDFKNEGQKVGNEGENLQSNLIFSFTDSFVNGQARLEYIIDGESRYVVLDKIGETYQTPVKSEMIRTGIVDMQLVITEGVEENEIPKFKSNVFYLPYGSSINAEIEQPEESEEWIDIANTKLNQVDNVDIDIKTYDDITKVEITKKDGTKKEAIVSGSGGTVTDVQVDGVSVTSNGIANIELQEKFDNKQNLLKSGENIKTINGQSIVGSGNIEIESNTGTTNYNDLNNKPSINDVELSGNKTLDELGIQPKGNYLTEYNESDPTVPSYVKSITEEDISSWNNKSEFSGSYDDLSNKPTIISIEEVKAITGELNNLSTEDKTNLVNAINEIFNNSGEEACHIIPIYKSNFSSYTSTLSLNFSELENIKKFYESVDKNSQTAAILMIYSDYNNIWLLPMRMKTIKDGSNSLSSSGIGLSGFRYMYRCTCSCVIYQSNGVINNITLNTSDHRSYDFQQIMFKNNTASYTPTEDYNPATKKYVDNATKPTIVTTITGDTLVLNHNQDARLGELTNLILTMPTSYGDYYESEFSFKSGETATTLTYSGTPLIFVGDDVDSDGLFIPEPNTIYEVSVKNVGTNGIVARVGSV